MFGSGSLSYKMVLEKLAEAVLQFVDGGVTILVVMLFYEGYRWIAVGNETGAVADGGRRAADWLKEKGVVPFTKEHREKYGRIGGKYSKRAFSMLMMQFQREKIEYKLIVDLKDKVKNITKDKTAVQALAPAAPPDPDTDLVKVEKLKDDVVIARKEATEIFKKWRRIKSTTFKHQTEIKRVIKQLRNLPDTDLNKIKDLETEEDMILKRHEDTKNEIQSLKQLIIDFEKAAEEATKQVTTGTAPIFDLVAARNKLIAFDFSDGNKICNRLEKLQGQGSPTNPGVLKLLAAITVNIKKLL